MKNNLRYLYVSILGMVLGMLGFASCQKQEPMMGEGIASEAVFLGYQKSDECSTGYIFNFINTDPNKNIKVARKLPGHIDEELFRFYPIKVKLTFDIKDESCSNVLEVINIKEITVIQ